MLLGRQMASSGCRVLAVPTQLNSYIHTTHVTKDETSPSGALIEAAKGMRVIPTRGQAAKEKMYMFIQVCDPSARFHSDEYRALLLVLARKMNSKDQTVTVDCQHLTKLS